MYIYFEIHCFHSLSQSQSRILISTALIWQRQAHFRSGPPIVYAQKICVLDCHPPLRFSVFGKGNCIQLMKINTRFTVTLHLGDTPSGTLQIFKTKLKNIVLKNPKNSSSLNRSFFGPLLIPKLL